jgi:hypothetical protein
MATIRNQKTESEYARPIEAEQRRRVSEQVKAIEQTAESVAGSVKVAVYGVEQVAGAAQQSVQNGFGTAFDVGQSSLTPLMRAVGIARQNALIDTEEMGKNVQAIVQTTRVLACGFQELSGEMLKLSRDRLEKNIDALTTLSRCRSIQDVFALQSSLVRGNLELTLQNNRRVAELSLRLADQASQAIYDQATEIVPGDSQRAA